jgi:hypothetical protein
VPLRRWPACMPSASWYGCVLRGAHTCHFDC